jgi:parallel beta-helix repeat protein
MTKYPLPRKWLAIGIILLFIGTGIIPAIAQDTEKQSSRGNWLYVGGSGPGNYTKIQDAINASMDGDTVYVYDDSAPYHEIININKSITLLGENQQTTIIDGSDFPDSIITINALYVTLCNLTLKNAEREGVMIHSSYATVSQMTIQDSSGYSWIGAITVYFPEQQNRGSIDKILIQNNTIVRTWTGIELSYCNQAMITGNVLVNNINGIEVIGSFHNDISANFISECEVGIVDYMSGKNIYRGNTLLNNTCGMEYICSTRDIIEKNNFLNNTQQAFFVKALYLSLAVIRNMLYDHNFYFLLNYRILRPTIWRQNYWNESRILPYVIVGEAVKDPYDPNGVTKRFNFDMNPAQEPYDIPGMRR